MSDREKERFELILDSIQAILLFLAFLVVVIIYLYRSFGVVDATLIMIILLLLVFLYLRKRKRDDKDMESILNKFMRRKTHNPGRQRKNMEPIEKEKETNHQNDGE